MSEKVLEEKNHLIRVDYYNLLREVSEAPMSKLTRAKVNHLVNSLIAESASKSVRISQLVEAVTLANNVMSVNGYKNKGA